MLFWGHVHFSVRVMSLMRTLTLVMALFLLAIPTIGCGGGSATATAGPPEPEAVVERTPTPTLRATPTSLAAVVARESPSPTSSDPPFPALVGFERGTHSFTVRVAVPSGSRGLDADISVSALDDHGNHYGASEHLAVPAQRRSDVMRGYYGGYGSVTERRLPDEFVYVLPITVEMPEGAPIESLTVTGIGSVPMSGGRPLTVDVRSVAGWNRGHDAVLSIGVAVSLSEFLEIELVSPISPLDLLLYGGAVYYADFDVRNRDYNDTTLQFGISVNAHRDVSVIPIQNVDGTMSFVWGGTESEPNGHPNTLSADAAAQTNSRVRLLLWPVPASVDALVLQLGSPVLDAPKYFILPLRSRPPTTANSTQLPLGSYDIDGTSPGSRSRQFTEGYDGGLSQYDGVMSLSTAEIRSDSIRVHSQVLVQNANYVYVLMARQCADTSLVFGGAMREEMSSLVDNLGNGYRATGCGGDYVGDLQLPSGTVYTGYVEFEGRPPTGANTFTYLTWFNPPIQFTVEPP